MIPIRFTNMLFNFIHLPVSHLSNSLYLSASVLRVCPVWITASKICSQYWPTYPSTKEWDITLIFIFCLYVSCITRVNLACKLGLRSVWRHTFRSIIYAVPFPFHVKENNKSKYEKINSWATLQLFYIIFVISYVVLHILLFIDAMNVINCSFLHTQVL